MFITNNTHSCFFINLISDGNDLITCMIIAENGAKTRRYLSIISSQLVLVEPHGRFLGWGVCKLSCYLQDAEVKFLIFFLLHFSSNNNTVLGYKN